MFTYALRRVLTSIPVLLAVTVLVFTLVELAPGDVADYFINPEANTSPEALAEMRRAYGLDQPAPVRYAVWLGQVVRGDLGYSFVSGEPVVRMILRRFQNTATLMSVALVVSVVLGVALGVFTAVRQYSWWDHSLSALSFLAISMPAFVTGILALYLFAVLVPIFPSGGLRSVGVDAGFWDRVHHLILPAAVLSLAQTATFMRYTRFSVLEVLRADYVRTARGKGLPEVRVTMRHGLPNALIPVITVIGLSLPVLVVGAVFTETIFSWPGMGTLYLNAVGSRDVPLVMGLNLFIAVVVLTANLLTDLAYGLVDPRIRYA
ncbi:MAG TPA: ABC transporter permease [Pseudomonadales bacterium]|nr:ABC transporter permease [Pseudomonadales bacterium]